MPGLKRPIAVDVCHGRWQNAPELNEVADLLAEEINVHNVILTDEIGDFATMTLKPNGNILGPRLGSDVQKVLSLPKKGTGVSLKTTALKSQATFSNPTSTTWP